MNPFQRARSKAKEIRARLVGKRANKGVPAGVLIGSVEKALNLGVEPVEATYPDLGGGSAVLRRDQRFIYVSKVVGVDSDQYYGFVAHELGHWYLDSSGDVASIARADVFAKSDGTPAVITVEAYGARERKELQANVFARELLLPREVARDLAMKGWGAKKVAEELSIPLEYARQQLLDALLLPGGDDSPTTLEPASPDQQAAAEAPETCANVVAGPGTGKTSTLIHRVRYLIEEKKVDPDKILVLTFTNKAALELVERLHGTEVEGASEVWAGTFHAFGLEFLRKYHHLLGVTADVHLLDTLGAITMLASALPGLELKYYNRLQDPLDWLRSVINGIKRCKEELVTPEDYRERMGKVASPSEEIRLRREDMATLYEAYERQLASRKMVDFVDLIAKPATAIRNDRATVSELADKFQHILVDEYQDVTKAMVVLLKQLAKNAKLWVVGDVRQAIYHWRGASVKSLVRFDSEFRSHAGSARIRQYPLDNNRRNSQEILDLVEQAGKIHALQAQLPLNSMVATNGRCGMAPLVVTCAEKASIVDAVVAKVKELRASGFALRGQSVLCRRKEDVEDCAATLRSSGIPVLQIGELTQRPEIKAILCLMQLRVERGPRALVGLMSTPGLSLPKADFEILQAASSDVRWQRGRWLEDVPSGLSPAALGVIDKLLTLIGPWKHSSNPWDFVCDMLLEHRLGLHLDDESPEAWVARIALWQFAYSVRNGDGDMKEARLSRYLLRLRLRQRIGDADSERELPPEAASLDAIRVQTVHASKGLEYEAVHVAYVNAETYGPEKREWVAPDSPHEIVPPEVLGSSVVEYDHEAAIERNNLLYVALSRAKKRLLVYRETQFGKIAPQLQHHPATYEEVTFNGPKVVRANDEAPRTFPIPTAAVPFERFDAYAICPLQFWYQDVLGLRREEEIGPEVRARWAVMKALRAVASGEEGTPASHLKRNWAEYRLPPKKEDPSLAADATKIYKRGLELIQTMRQSGATYAELTTTVGDLDIVLPWGFVSTQRHMTILTLVRFSRTRISDILTLLRPMVSGLHVRGSRNIAIRSVLVDTEDAVRPSARVEQTKAFDRAVRFLKGDSRPNVGRHCARCPFVTLCPSVPPPANEA